MNPDAEQVMRNHFVEEIAMSFETEGLPRMYGRVIGFMLICSPAQQSSADLAEALNASRGAISQATRALLQIGFIQRAPRPGSRAMYFEIKPDALDHLLHGAVAKIIIMRELADRGLAIMKNESEESRQRIQAFRDVYAFMETEYPKLLERWDQTRKEKE